MISPRYATANQVAAPSLRSRAARRSALLRRPSLDLRLGSSVPVRLTLVTVLVAIAFLLYLAQASQVSVLELNIAELQYAQTQVNIDNANLHTTVANLRSLPRISAEARNQLHMAQPDLSTTIWLNPVVPGVALLPAVAGQQQVAETRSQPLAFLKRLARELLASL